MFKLFYLLLVGVMLLGCQTTEVDDGAARDLAAAAALRSKLVSDSDIRSSEYSIDVKDGVLKISGLARSKSEMSKVISHATSVRFIKEVVSYIELDSDVNPSDGS